MTTTDNEVVDNRRPKKTEIAKDDIKSMKADYNKGVTIDQIADDYGYTPLEVEQIVVTPVEGDTNLPTQADLDSKDTKK